MTEPGNAAVISALRALRPRQREAIVLRHYTDLSEAQTAAMGISTRAVTSHIAPAMAALHTVMDRSEE